MSSPLARLCFVLLALCVGAAAQQWQAIGSAHGNGPVAYDPVRDRLVLFDGTDTWEWDGAGWAKRRTVDRPPSLARMAWDPVGLRVLAFGGLATAAAHSAQTWAWDGVRWSRLDPMHVPDGRIGHAMVTDAGRQRIVLFGGSLATSCTLCPGPTPLGDTWLWDGTDWVEQGGLLPRNYAAMAYDAGRQRVVLFGGDQAPGHGIYGTDTMEWDGAAWRLVGTTTRPSGRQGHAMAYDAARQRVVLHGGFSEGLFGPTYFGDTWEFDGGEWTRRAAASAPGQMAFHALVYAPSLQRVLMIYGSTWAWNGVGWVEQIAEPATARLQPAIAYDGARQRVVLYGGAPFDETWEYDGRGWVRAASNGAPGVLSGHAMAFDAARAETILYDSGRTWSWDGATWTLRAQAGPQRDGAIAYDGARDEIVLRTENAQTWTWSGTAWSQRSGGGPSARIGAALAYDPMRQRVVLFGGTTSAQSPTGALSDTWEWDGTTWTQAFPSTAPPSRYSHGLAWDQGLGAVVLAGGRVWETSALAQDTWFWDGSAWTALPVGAGPFAGVAMAEDAGRVRLVAVAAPIRYATSATSLRTWELGAYPVAAVTRSGNGCGASTVPDLDALGEPRAGRAQFAIDVGGGQPVSGGALLLAAQPASIPLGGNCSLYVDLSRGIALPFATGSSGAASLPLPIPAGVALGAMLHAQAGVFEAGAPFAGIALTRRLSLTIGG